MTNAELANLQELILEHPSTITRPFLLAQLLEAAPSAVRQEWKAEVAASIASEKTRRTSNLDRLAALIQGL